MSISKTHILKGLRRAPRIDELENVGIITDEGQEADGISFFNFVLDQGIDKPVRVEAYSADSTSAGFAIAWVQTDTGDSYYLPAHLLILDEIPKLERGTYTMEARITVSVLIETNAMNEDEARTNALAAGAIIDAPASWVHLESVEVEHGSIAVVEFRPDA